MIENYLLEYLVSFADTGTISKTAEEFHVAPATISRGLQKLEQKLDVAILDHQPQKLALTPAGKYTVRLAKEILEKQQQLIPAVKNFAQKEITLTATLPDPMMLLKERLKSDNYILDQQLISPKQVKPSLLHYQFDLVFSNQKINDEQIVSDWIGDAQLFIKITKYNPLYSKDQVTFSDLKGHEFVVYEQIGIWRNIISKYIPALFIYQDNQQATDELITKSNFPIFKTNLTIKLDAYKKLQDHKRKLIPISNPEAKLHIYTNYRIKDKEKLSNLLALSKKLMR
ncbi:LysR family transcriptional regulator [uncultured Lactobacillus sp.]|uniref:LysR family transcriptional regulator n=1 Tax=uncultured Lactobacillus sp. TaxID=153152 RepID=UPI002805D49A|nr:LysR family transcriptional regulator [uncultured Lactobacillus sp.]